MSERTRAAVIVSGSYRPAPGTSQEQARDTRARAWAYVFQCFHRREGQEDSPSPAALDDTRGESQFGSRTDNSIPE